MKPVEVAPQRLDRWLSGFAERHGGVVEVAPGPASVVLRAGDGAVAECEVPFPPLAVHPAWPYAGLVDHALRDRRVGLVLLRRGGWAVGIADGPRLVESRVGRRYVQGRTAAGGWSQQRFARRREGQAAGLVEDLAAAAAELLAAPRTALDAVVTGGDRLLLKRLLADRRLEPIRDLVTQRVVEVPDPRRRVLESAVEQARAVRVRLHEPTG